MLYGSCSPTHRQFFKNEIPRAKPEQYKMNRLKAIFSGLVMFLFSVLPGQCGIVFTNLYAFSGDDGSEPYAGLVEGKDGNLYGTTSLGGTNGGYGTVFRITPNGNLTSLYSFDYTNGAYPDAALILASDGNFYGTTYSGGSNDYGTVFKINCRGALTSLHAFSGLDGDSPEAALVAGPNNMLYGTTMFGGLDVNGTIGNGTVFAVNLSGDFTNLFTFDYGTNGQYPEAALTFGSDGLLYGTTSEVHGTAFSMTTNGKLINLWQLSDFAVGSQPQSPIIQGNDSNLYGTTSSGYGFSGAVFRILPNGSIAAVHIFSDYFPTDGAEPTGGIILSQDGYFYGTTEAGGEFGNGTIYKLSTNGDFALLHSFTGYDGSMVRAGLIQGSDGSFYGTALVGAPNCSNGTVFKLTITPPSLPEFISTTFTNSAIVLTFTTEPGQIYQLQCNSDMNSSNWTNLGDSIFSDDNTVSVSDLMTNGQRFYRVVLLQNN
jgi:uncharacterized repeat protein (TIGR03803 family)